MRGGDDASRRPAERYQVVPVDLVEGVHGVEQVVGAARKLTRGTPSRWW